MDAGKNILQEKARDPCQNNYIFSFHPKIWEAGAIFYGCRQRKIKPVKDFMFATIHLVMQGTGDHAHLIRAWNPKERKEEELLAWNSKEKEEEEKREMKKDDDD